MFVRLYVSTAGTHSMITILEDSLGLSAGKYRMSKWVERISMCYTFRRRVGTGDEYCVPYTGLQYEDQSHNTTVQKKALPHRLYP